MRRFGSLVAGIVLAMTLGTILVGCAVDVREGRRCPRGWEPERRLRSGRVIAGHCR